jgi:ferritin-like metal-binding protein YciE
MKLESLHDLLVDELRDIYNAEKQMLGSLPQMAEAASSPELKAAFQQHEQETRGQVARLEEIFRELEEPPGGKTCRGMEGLIEEGSEVIEEDADPSVKDAALIVAAQKAEHYEIASYGSLCIFAETLGLDRIKQLLKQTMAEEEAADEKLTQIAEAVVNVEAATK